MHKLPTPLFEKFDGESGFALPEFPFSHGLIVASSEHVVISKRAISTLADAILSSIPLEARENKVLFNPFLVIPSHEYLIKNPASILPFLEATKKHLIKEGIGKNGLATIRQFTQVANYIIELDQKISSKGGQAQNSEELKSKIRALDQAARIIAFLRPKLSEELNKVVVKKPILRLPFYEPDVDVAEIAENKASGNLPSDLSIESLLALNSAENTPDLELKPEESLEGTEKLTRIKKRSFIDKDKLARVLKYTFFTSVPVLIIYSAIQNPWATAFGCLAIELLRRFVNALGEDESESGVKSSNSEKSDSEKNTALKQKSSGGKSWFGFGDGRDTNDSSDSANQNDRNQEKDSKESSSQREVALTNSAPRTQVNIASNSPSNIGGHVDHTKERVSTLGNIKSKDPEFMSFMSVLEPYVLTSGSGNMITLNEWLKQFSNAELNFLNNSLYRGTTVSSIEEHSEIFELETEIKLLISSASVSFPLPVNYEVCSFSCFDADGLALNTATPIAIKRCVLGSFTAEIPAETKQVAYRIRKSSEDCIIDLDKLNLILPAVSITSSIDADFLDSFVSVIDSKDEVAALCYTYLASSEFIYSADFFVGKYLRQKRKDLTEALLGLRIGTCDPFALIVASTFRHTGIPAFILGGLVPKSDQTGNNFFDGDAGHAQACTFVANQPLTFDLTLDAKQATYDPVNLPVNERSLLLLEALPKKGDELVSHARHTRDCLLTAKDRKDDWLSRNRKKIENAYRKITNQQFIPNAHSTVSSGHTFQNRIPPVNDLHAKITAVKVTQYCNTLARLVSKARFGIDVLAPLRFYESYPSVPAIIYSAERYIPAKLKDLLDPKIHAQFTISHIFDYIEQTLSDPKISNNSKIAVIDWCTYAIGDPALTNVLYQTKAPKKRDDFFLRVKVFNLEDSLKLLELVMPILDNEEVKKIIFAYLGKLSSHIGYTEQNKVLVLEPQMALGEVQAIAGPLVSAIEKEFSQRSVLLSSAERHQLTQILSWLSMSATCYGTNRNCLSIAGRAIRAISGDGQTSQQVFIDSIKSGPQGLRDTSISLFEEIKLENAFNFANDPALKKQIEITIGSMVVSRLLEAEVSEALRKDFEAFCSKITKMGLTPSTGHEEKNLAKWIRKNSAKFAKEDTHFNVPDCNVCPGSFITSHLSDSNSAILWNLFETLQNSTSGLSRSTLSSGWAKTDENLVVKRLLDNLEFREFDDKIFLKLERIRPINGYFCDFLEVRILVEACLKSAKRDLTENFELPEVYLELLSRIDFSSSLPGLNDAFEKIKASYPELWEDFLDQDYEFNCHFASVLESCLSKLTYNLPSNEFYSALIWYVENLQRYDYQEVSTGFFNSDLLLASEDSALNAVGPFEVKLNSRARETAVIFNHLFLLEDLTERVAIQFCKDCLGIPQGIFNPEALRLYNYKARADFIAEFWRQAIPRSHDMSEPMVTLLEKFFPEIEEDINWICKTVPTPYRQYLFTRTGHTVVRANSGDFDEFRPYAIGDDIRRIDWANSSRSGRTLIRTYIEEESRHLNLVYDISCLTKSLTEWESGDQSQMPELLRDMAMHLYFALNEGLEVDLVLVGRSVIHSFRQNEHEKLTSADFYKSESFWASLFLYIQGAQNFFEQEQRILAGAGEFNPAGYNIFAHELPKLTAGRMNYFVLSENSLNYSSDYLSYLYSRGELVEVVSAESIE